jgi:hypothetical protein
MFRIKQNISNIKREKRLLDIAESNVVVNSDKAIVTIKTQTPHHLKDNDQILLSYQIDEFDKWESVVEHLNNGNKIARLTKLQTVIENDIKGDEIQVDYASGYYIKDGNMLNRIPDAMLNNILSKYSSFRDKIHVSIIDANTFKFQISRYKLLYVDKIYDTVDYGLFHTKEILPIFLDKNESFFVRRLDYSYKFNRIAEQDDIFLEVDILPQGITEYLGSDTVYFNGNIYVWTYDEKWLSCSYNSENEFKYSYDTEIIIGLNDILGVEDTRFVDYTRSALHDKVSIFEVNEFINVNIMNNNSVNIDLGYEEKAQMYFNEVKDGLIGKTIDYEKRCFNPYFDKTGTLTGVAKINFNLFLRDRSGSEDWNTNDGKGWNQMRIDENGTFETVDSKKLTNGDLVSVLGFTDEDIYYRKKKVEKTFLRLSFYDSPDPMTQLLLFYSTIFLDSGDLYTKYIKNINSNKVSTTPIVMSNDFGDNNLTITFSVTDKYNRTKSSEGFYLYLFPDGVYNGEKRTIYMKAEFNNAKTGTTVPLIYPHKALRPLNFSSREFPKSLMTDDGDVSELFRLMYIPLTVTYDNDLRDYIYYFNVPINNKTFIDNANGGAEITLGLYEPKLNPLN